MYVCIYVCIYICIYIGSPQGLSSPGRPPPFPPRPDYEVRARQRITDREKMLALYGEYASGQNLVTLFYYFCLCFEMRALRRITDEESDQKK